MKRGLIIMKKSSTRKTLAILAMAGVIMTAGCRAGDLTSSQPSGTPVTAEVREPEYSADLVLTVVFPDKTEYTSTDNGVTWIADGNTVYYNDMPAYLTVIYPDPISITGEVPVTMTIHNNNRKTDMLTGGSEYDLQRHDENGEWVPAEYADKSINYAFTQQEDLILLSKDYYLLLSDYEPTAGRYKLTKNFTIDGSEMYGLLNPSSPGGIYTMTAEFNALA